MNFLDREYQPACERGVNADALQTQQTPLRVLVLICVMLFPALAAQSQQTICDSTHAHVVNINPNCRIDFEFGTTSTAGIFHSVRATPVYPASIVTASPPSGWTQTLNAPTSVTWDAPGGTAIPPGIYNNGIVLTGPSFPQFVMYEFLDENGNVICTERVVVDCQSGSCVKVDSVNVDCHGPDAQGNETYTVSMRVYNGSGATATLNLSSPDGPLAPASFSVPAGPSMVTTMFTDTPPVTGMLTILAQLVDPTGGLCEDSVTVMLPDCQPPSDCLRLDRLRIDCDHLDQSGNQQYALTFNVFNGSGMSGTLSLSAPEGSISPTSVTAPAGNSSHTVIFTDLPPVDAVVQLIGELAVMGAVCRDTLTEKLPDCQPDPQCYILDSLRIRCVGENAAGNFEYAGTMYLTNPGPASITLNFMSPQGTFAPSSASVAVGTGIMVSFTFEDTPPVDTFFEIFAFLPGTNCRDSLLTKLPDCEPVQTGGCGDPACMRDSLIVNTGYNHAASGIYSIGQQDAFWELTMSPNSGLTLPSPPWVISKNPAWANPFPNSQWISPYNTQSLNMNNQPPADPYRLEFCFCICDGVDSIRIDMRILADNMATVLLDGTPLFAFPNPNAVSNFQQPAHFVEVVAVQPGKHCLQIDLRNWSGVAMGVNAAGVITNANPGGGSILLDPACCDTTGTIIGQKIYDRNCNGVEDNRPNNQTLEPPLPGWTITLNPGGFTAVTDANGFFYFNDVPPGTYTLTETPQSGWVPTNPTSGSQTVTVGANQVVYANFLNCKEPPDPCDEFSEGRLDTDCCTYHFDISNVVGDITQISYNVTGGTVNSMTFDPCAYTTVPASLAGSSSGVINFGTPCNDNMQVSVDVTPTTASGEICIEWVVVHADGSRCVYETCWTCERPPIERCDDIKAQPFHQQNVSIDYRTFTVINQKIPSSPICSIEISMEDSGGNPPTSGWQGGDLSINGALIPTGTRFVFPYDRIPNAGASDISSYSADTVRFNLGIDYTISWTGTVTFVIVHCDGDTCVVRYGPWTAAKPGGSGPVVVVAEKAERRLFGQGLRIRNTSGGPIRWVSVAVENGQDEVYAVSAAQWLGAEQYPGTELLSQSEQGRRKALFTFAEDLASGDQSDLIHLVIARDSSMTQPPVIRWTTYGDDGNAISSDTITIGGTVTTVRGPSTTLSPEDFSLLESFPNPARTQLTVNFAMGKAANIRLELYDGSGRLVSTIREGYETQGLRSVPLSTAGLSPGRYFLRLSSGDRVDTQSFVVVK